MGADATNPMEYFMPRSRFVWPLSIACLVFLAVFIAGARGAGALYDRIVFGALPLALALGCLGGAAYLCGSGARRRAWIASSIACWLLSAGALAIWIRPEIAAGPQAEPRLPQDRIWKTLFTELQPLELPDCRFERFGERGDGGYLMCGNLLGSVKAGYSYGIDGYDQWGCDIASKLNVRVHEYDCFNLHKPSCSNGATVFHPECIGPSRKTDEKGRIFDSLENHFGASGDGAGPVVLKMDVEGAEWDSLLQTPSSVLERIDQFAVELHYLGTEKQVEVVRKLKENFYIAHLHYNNWSCTDKAGPFPASVVEALFVNKRLTRAGGPLATTTHPLDARNNLEAPDCQIPAGRWTYPVEPAEGIRGRFLRYLNFVSKWGHLD